MENSNRSGLSEKMAIAVLTQRVQWHEWEEFRFPALDTEILLQLCCGVHYVLGHLVELLQRNHFMILRQCRADGNDRYNHDELPHCALHFGRYSSQ